jgi:hypothetical protein
MVLSIIFLEDKHKILLHLSILYEYQHRICFSIQSQLQLVKLHRNRRYFVIKLHTWFCLSYFLKTNMKFYSIYQYFMSINSFVNTVSTSQYSRPIQWPVTQISTSQQFFLLRLFNQLFRCCLKGRITVTRTFVTTQLLTQTNQDVDSTSVCIWGQFQLLLVIMPRHTQTKTTQNAVRPRSSNKRSRNLLKFENKSRFQVHTTT